jgi:hypothetical protein
MSDADLGRNPQRIDRSPLMEAGRTGNRGTHQRRDPPTSHPSYRSTSRAGWTLMAS